MVLAKKHIKVLADGGKILSSEIIGGGITVGNVYYVIKSTEAFYANFQKDNDFKYTDRSRSIHTTIQSALDATVSNRNDYVIVMPSESDYDLTAALTMSKKAVHLICPGGLGNEIGATNVARIHQTADVDVMTLSQSSIEIAGFYFKNYDLQAGITGATSVAGVGVYGCNIHHNTFAMRSTTVAAEPMINFSGDAGAWGSIENNWMITTVSNATYTSIIKIESSATSARVKNNEITIGDGCTATIAISNQAVKGVTSGNIISECGGSGVADGGTVTVAVSIHVSGNAIGNRCAVAAGQALSGGTPAHSFVDNMDGATGAGNGAASNLET